jgi:hypothetical protein
MALFNTLDFSGAIEMCKEKSISEMSIPQGTTLGEACIQLGAVFTNDVLKAEDPTKIDWSNLKVLFAALIQQFGPILAQLLVLWLTPKKTN